MFYIICCCLFTSKIELLFFFLIFYLVPCLPICNTGLTLEPFIDFLPSYAAVIVSVCFSLYIIYRSSSLHLFFSLSLSARLVSDHQSGRPLALVSVFDSTSLSRHICLSCLSLSLSIWLTHCPLLSVHTPIFFSALCQSMSVPLTTLPVSSHLPLFHFSLSICLSFLISPPHCQIEAQRGRCSPPPRHL